MTDFEKITNKKALKEAAFGIENALNMYALSFCTMPAEGIYDSEFLERHSSLIERCHIYLIGYTPKIEFVEASQDGQILTLTFEVLSKSHLVKFTLPEGHSLQRDGETWYIIDGSLRKYWTDENRMQTELARLGIVRFEVKYVGQAYGRVGSRNAIDRLTKHETLQKIALKGAPEGYRLTLLLLEIESNNRIIFSFNPSAKNQDQGDARIENGLAKLFNTTEAERISLYEAALIRYFYPDFNKEFKDSFPSTNLKILQDCYEKDFSAVVAEICIDELPFHLCSGAVPAKLHHVAKHDLHKSEMRRMFFGL